MASLIENAPSLAVEGVNPLLPESGRPNPFLSGINKPIQKEETIVQLEVFGSIPPGLDGQYLRIGPNPIVPDPAGYHWFSGDGMVHAIALKNGKALWYRNRWIRSAAVASALGEKPAVGARHGVCDTVNTNVMSIGGRTFALVEAGSYPVELSDTLDTQTFVPFDGTLTGSFSAHPHLDPLTGEYHAITYEGNDRSTIRHVLVAADGRVIREERVTVAHGPSIHDCAITARYVLILDFPVTFSMELAVAGSNFPYRWNPAHQARVGLLPRAGRGDETLWIDVDPCYVFHIANAYDLPDGRLVLDAIVYDTMFASSSPGPDAPPRGLERWTIDPGACTVDRRSVDRTAQEFPRVDERRFGQLYRFAYTVGLPERQTQGDFANFLIKHDLITGGRAVHDFGPHRFPGEFVFVPAHASSGEDEGWLIGLVVDMNTETTDLVILSASDFTSSAVATIRIPHRVPQGFHGNWIAASGQPAK